ncbi:MAG: FAD-dependent oxidoreductase, partial [Gaiellaceae bacterium]
MTVEPRLPAWWLEQALAAEGDPPPAPTLAVDAAADVAIVGGGYTGLWTALALRERAPELRVTLLEAEICGHGPSGRNGGFVHGYWASLASILPLLGRERALELARAGEQIIPGIRAWAESRGEDVWLREAGMLEVSAAPAQDPGVEKAVAAAAGLGREDQAVALTPDELARRVSSPVFRGGVFFPECATVHPGLLVRALRRAALEAGVTLHEGTRVTAVRTGSPNELETPGGSLRAREVVLATNAALTGWAPASRNLTNFGSYVVLTEPAPELLAELGWTGGEAIVDGRMFLHYFRTTDDGRVLMGSGSGPIGFGGRIDDRFSRDGPTAARAEAGLRRLLPGLAGVRVERAWGGPIDVSADHLPFFRTKPGTRIHYGAGYSGHGVGPAWLGGRILASLALGADDEWTRLPLATRAVPRLPPEPLRRVGGGLVRWAIM